MLGERVLCAEFLDGLDGLMEHTRVSRSELRAREWHWMDLEVLLLPRGTCGPESSLCDSWDTNHTGLDAPCDDFPLGVAESQAR